ncbi:MAG: hypothetical protein ACI8ZV_000431, partial [Chitinophagales bacterium]
GIGKRVCRRVLRLKLSKTVSLVIEDNYREKTMVGLDQAPSVIDSA